MPELALETEEGFSLAIEALGRCSRMSGFSAAACREFQFQYVQLSVKRKNLFPKPKKRAKLLSIAEQLAGGG